jgi:hypothetical protein
MAGPKKSSKVLKLHLNAEALDHRAGFARAIAQNLAVTIAYVPMNDRQAGGGTHSLRPAHRPRFASSRSTKTPPQPSHRIGLATSPTSGPRPSG